MGRHDRMPRWQMPVIAVALDRIATGFRESRVRVSRPFAPAAFSRRPCERSFFHDGAVQIVHAVAQRNLRKRQPHRNPVGREMIEVIEINAADRQVAKLLDGRGGFIVGEDGGLRFKGEWDEPGESMRLVLQLAEQAQMLHPLSSVSI